MTERKRMRAKARPLAVQRVQAQIRQARKRKQARSARRAWPQVQMPANSPNASPARQSEPSAVLDSTRLGTSHTGLVPAPPARRLTGSLPVVRAQLNAIGTPRVVPPLVFPSSSIALACCLTLEQRPPLTDSNLLHGAIEAIQRLASLPLLFCHPIRTIGKG